MPSPGFVSAYKRPNYFVFPTVIRVKSTAKDGSLVGSMLHRFGNIPSGSRELSGKQCPADTSGTSHPVAPFAIGNRAGNSLPPCLWIVPKVRTRTPSEPAGMESTHGATRHLP
jgi:hypothetical protein